MEVKIVNKSNHRTPEYESAGAAGFDLKANIDTPMVIEPLERVLVQQVFSWNYHMVMNVKLDLVVVWHINMVCVRPMRLER